MKCEKSGCNVQALGYTLLDYCAVCGKNLCREHMLEGCCGKAPATSGTNYDDDSAAICVEDQIAKMTHTDYIPVSSDATCEHCGEKNRDVALLAGRYLCRQCLERAHKKIVEEIGA